ncbi:MAG: hypothetical protein IT327_18860 [Anaerolineae bacterium]|jgi:hypothetical protein|nr:hypothetical protein [Anaerolineae bacterium]
MTIIIAFTTASFVASALVVSALALSSRLSEREGFEECYAEESETSVVASKATAPFSLN